MATLVPSDNTPYVPGTPRSQAGGQRRQRGDWAVWWHEIDRVLLVLVLSLMAIGTLAVAAASPSSARRLSTAKVHVDDLNFFWQHLRWQFMGLLVLVLTSRLSRENARRWGVVLGITMIVGLVAVFVPHLGYAVKGAHRWINLGFTKLQPSEFLKPAFAITLAWVLSWRQRDAKLPVMMMCTGIMAVVAALLMAEPDFGSTVLFVAVWFVLMLLAGLSPKLVGMSAGAGVLGLLAAYEFYENGRNRINAFLFQPCMRDSFDQVCQAKRTLLNGGWTGTGLWLGSKTQGLPEAHTDYIFSVIGEQFGLLMCALIVLLYFAMVARVLLRLGHEDDFFSVLAATGLIAQLGGQAFINILVNLKLAPSKGMTLPLISYGGSSTIALCLTVGFLLAITRRNPYLKRDPFARRPGAAPSASLFS
jgi:cell division protein FtsW